MATAPFAPKMNPDEIAAIKKNSAKDFNTHEACKVAVRASTLVPFDGSETISTQEITFSN